MRLYADEDIEEDIVAILRGEGVNITSARELGHRGKPDEFHAALALRERRFLLTKNDKHFWDDRRLPLHRTFGLVIIKDDMGDPARYGKTLGHLLDHVAIGQLHEGDKIRISPDRISIKGREKDGVVRTTHYRKGPGGPWIWEGQGEPPE